MRGISITLGTVVLIVVLLVTLVAVLVFFRGGIGSTGGALGGLFPDISGQTDFDINPAHWSCAGDWRCLYNENSDKPGRTTGIGAFANYTKCEKKCSKEACWAPGECECRCVEEG